MDTGDANKQIGQMIEFIKQEAREKAEEIEVKTEQEFNVKKLGKVVNARRQILEDFAKMKKEAGAKKRIARSREINSARVEQMQARMSVLKQLRKEVTLRLATVCQNPKYPQLIKALIIQGLITIMEDHVEVLCRESDLKVVQSVFDSAVSDWKALMKKECGVEPSSEVVLNTKRFLPGPPRDGYEGETCCGGVVLSARKGKILCRNTLDARFELAYEAIMPSIREMIFGKRAAAVAKKVREMPAHGAH